MHATRDHARQHWDCPLSKTFAHPQVSCRGDLCPLWRWTTGEAHAQAVKRIADRTGEKGPFRNAAAEVAKDPVAHGLHGYCGLGGGL